MESRLSRGAKLPSRRLGGAYPSGEVMQARLPMSIGRQAVPSTKADARGDFMQRALERKVNAADRVSGSKHSYVIPSLPGPEWPGLRLDCSFGDEIIPSKK